MSTDLTQEFIPFSIVTKYQPSGDQPKAIAELVEGV